MTTVLLAKVRANHQRYQAQAQSADFLAKFTTLAIDVAFKAGRMEPVAPPPSPEVGISILPSGVIEPTLLNYPVARPGAISMPLEKFERICRRVEQEVTAGRVTPASEEELPKLIYVAASKP